jgi:hypothetical protein
MAVSTVTLVAAMAVVVGGSLTVPSSVLFVFWHRSLLSCALALLHLFLSPLIGMLNWTCRPMSKTVAFHAEYVVRCHHLRRRKRS